MTSQSCSWNQTFCDAIRMLIDHMHYPIFYSVEPSPIADIAFVKPKRSTVPGCSQTIMPQSSTIANVLPPTEKEQSAFFEQLKIAHPNSAILSLVERHPHLHPSPEKIRRLPSPLTTFYDHQYKGLNKTQLYTACQSAF